MRLLVCTGLATLAAATTLAGLAAWPSHAAPTPRLASGAALDAVICHARPPRVDMSFANGIQVVPAGSVVRVADAAITQADHAEIMFKLGLLQGHLMIGRALVEANQPTLALPHFGHPVRELYDDIRPDLDKRGLSQFDGELVSLEALAAGKPGDPAMWAQYDKVIRILGAVRATVPADLRNNEQFTLGVIGEIATVAAEDYNESVEGGTIAKPVEYHDSRGYLMYADGVLKALEARPDLKDPARLKAARARFTEMQTIVAPLLPPRKPIRTVAQYKAIVAQYKQAIAPTKA